ncbi:MAG: hypothetical protein FJZ57_08475 [Chlamydiae bacterium]|nr:hypothetical protein [Chlamydiota bacterium]
MNTPYKRSTPKKIAYLVISIHVAFILFISFGTPTNKKIKRDPLVVRTKTLAPVVTQPSEMKITPNNSNTTAAKNPAPKSTPPKAVITPTPTTKPIAKPNAKTKPIDPKPAQKTTETKHTKPTEKQQKQSTENFDIPLDLLNELEKKIANLDSVKDHSSKKTHITVPDRIDPSTITKYSSSDSFDFMDSTESYAEYLAIFLKQELKLPDFGEVKVEITLNKDGTVEKCLVLNSESIKNRKYLEERLPKLTFPNFKTNKTSKEKQHFVLTFCNEM